MLYVALSVLGQALLIVAGMMTHWLIGPFGVEATLANLLLAGLVITRLTFTSYVLPRATTLPTDRPRWTKDTVLACCSLIAAVAFLVIGYAFLAEPGNATSVWQVFVPLYAVSILFALLSAPLWLLWWTSRGLPEPGSDRPVVDVIVPAYNEADNIAGLLRSIDVAAGRYGGPVRVLVSDDGSCDDTAQIAWAEFARFRYARGAVLSAPNGGQAAALNRGLAVTDAEIVVRIDADCVMGPEALAYSVPWFRDPRIGSVGAMEEPRTDDVTWFHRLRTLETLFQFRFVRLGQSLVDGIVVIPGTFTAFRRDPVVLAGGFPVRMNGEDSDLTMQIGRLGYRVVIDPRIRSFEDVPRTIGEFVEQRTRWTRASFHVYARHVPLRSGFAGPRVWFWTIRRGFSWFSAARRAGGPHLHARTRAHPSQLPAECRHVPPALCRRRRDFAGHQPAAGHQAPALAQHTVDADLVRLRVSPATGRPRGRHLASHPPLRLATGSAGKFREVSGRLAS